MKVNIKRIDTSLPLPEYQTAGAAGFDLYSREDAIIKPHSVGLIPTNLIICTPEGYFLGVTLRSSSPKRKGLIIPHGIGVIDSDYCGNNDEILLQVYNITEQPVKIEKGERIGQALFIPVAQAEWEEVEKMEGPTRGGFGSTG